MATRTYDSKQVIITIGAHVVTGYAEDTFVNIEENGDGMSQTVGANGEVARSVSQNRTCNITLTLQQTSPSNDVLSALVDADRLTGDGLFSVAIADLRGSTVLTDSNSFIPKKAASGFGNAVGTREWTITTSNAPAYNVGGSR